MKTALYTLPLLVCLALGSPFSLNADLVAYWPLNDGAPGTPVSATGADDVIDDPNHDAEDAVVSGNGNDTWEMDPARGIVLSTTEGCRLVAGKQDIDMNIGFTWSLWVKVARTNKTDTGADVIIGSRNGIWNKVGYDQMNRWATISGYDVADDAWHHMAIVGSTEPEPRVSLYIDGDLIGSDTSFENNALIVNDVLEIGGSSRFSEDITGLMSDVAIWNEALSETRIIALANGDPVIPPKGFQLIVK
jgi:hypothetical protein